jgi:hypothetical protein
MGWAEARNFGGIGLALTGADRLGHFGQCFCRAAFHFFGSNVLDVCSEALVMHEGIGDFAIAVAPEHILKGHINA